MKNKTIKGISLALAAASLAGLIGCGGKTDTVTRDTSVNAASSLVDYSEYRDTRTADIFAWRGPTDLSDEQWTYFKESGINTLILDSGIDGARGAQFGSTAQENYIKKCAEYGIKAIGYTNGNLNTNVKDYKNKDFYSTIAGIDYTDEPALQEFSDIAAVIPDFASKYPNGKMFVCLNSSYAASLHLGTFNYRDYVSSWYNTVLSQLPEGMPRILGTDIYPLHNDEKYGYSYINETWLRSLAYLAEMKIAHPELTLHMAMQSMSFGLIENTSPRREPSKADCLFQAYVNMAFGFTEFSWFTYSTPPATPDDKEFAEKHVAMIDRNGKKTAIYDAVKAANALIYDLDEVMQSVSFCGVYPVYVKNDKKSNAMDEKAIRYLKGTEKTIVEVADFNVISGVQTDASLIVSQFKDEKGNEGFMIVNYNDPNENVTANVTLELADCDKIIVYRNGKAVTENVSGGKFAEAIPAGEGVFVIPYKA